MPKQDYSNEFVIDLTLIFIELKKNPRVAFLEACTKGDLNTIQTLLTDSSSTIFDDKYLNAVFSEACIANQIDAVKVLLEDSRINPSYSGNHELRICKENPNFGNSQKKQKLSL